MERGFIQSEAAFQERRHQPTRQGKQVTEKVVDRLIDSDHITNFLLNVARTCMTSDTRFFGNSRSVLLINPHKPYYVNNELCLTEIDTFKGFCNAPSFNIRLQNNHELIFPLKAYVNYYLQSIIQSALYNLSFVLLDNWNISPCSSSTVSFNITTVYQVELSIYAL